MPQAMHQAMLNEHSEQSTQRTQQTERNVRVQDSSKSSSVPDAAKAVDNGKSVESKGDPCPKNHVHRHGESSTCYWYGCRCTLCREFCTERQFYYRNMRRAGRYTPMTRVPAIGTQRRLHALETLGWSASHIATRLGVSGQRMRQIHKAALVSLENAEKVKAVYDKLWATPAPVSGPTNRTRARAARLKYTPPLGWDDDAIDNPDAEPATTDAVAAVDDLAIEMAVHGDKPKLRTAERHAVVIRLHAIRWSDKKIAGWIGVSDQTVFRDRRELSLAAWDQVDMTGQTGKAA